MGYRLSSPRAGRAGNYGRDPLLHVLGDGEYVVGEEEDKDLALKHTPRERALWAMVRWDQTGDGCG